MYRNIISIHLFYLFQYTNIKSKIVFPTLQCKSFIKLFLKFTSFIMLMMITMIKIINAYILTHINHYNYMKM